MRASFSRHVVLFIAREFIKICRWLNKFAIVINNRRNEKIHNIHDIQEYSKNHDRYVIASMCVCVCKAQIHLLASIYMRSLRVFDEYYFGFNFYFYRIFSRHIGQGRPLCKPKLYSWSLGGHQRSDTASSYYFSCVCVCVCECFLSLLHIKFDDCDSNAIMHS